MRRALIVHGGGKDIMSISDSRFPGVRYPVLVAMLVTGGAGCAALPADQGYQETSTLLEARTGVAPAFDRTERDRHTAPELPTTPISAEQAVRLAFLHSPRVAESYSRIGLSRADLETARRFANPGLGLSFLDASPGGEQVGRSLTLSFTDAVLLPVRKRYAAAALQQMQLQVAGELQDLATDVEIGWYHTVAADQISATRALIAEAATQSATLAERFFAAGNINRLTLAQEKAAAASAMIESARARSRAVEARAELATLLGLSMTEPWKTADLPDLPADTPFDSEALIELAMQNRLDLASAHKQVSLREDALAMTRRWRWLGRFEVGYEREREVDGGVIRGPTFVIELPFFNQGQDAMARAQAQRAQAQSGLDQATLQVRNDIHATVASTRLAWEVAERYRADLLPEREITVANTQAEVNFMLKGVFELILAKQVEYDTWQGYIESVRDYWITRARLRAAVGGRLPDDPGSPGPAPLRATSASEHHEHHEQRER